MKIEELITALRRLKVETGSLPCLGCGYEHGCSLHGCVIINEALERITMLKEHFSEESALKMAAQALETTPEALRQSAQFHAGDTVWVLTRDEDGVPDDVDGYMLLAVAGNAVIVTSFVDDRDDLDSTLAYHIRETAVNFDSDLAVFPLSDCYAVYEAARAALDVESEGTMAFTAFDYGYYLQRNDGTYKFTGATPEEMTRLACADRGIPIAQMPHTGIPLRRKFTGVKLNQLITTAWTLASEKNGKVYAIRYTPAGLLVKERTVSTSSLVLKAASNLMNATTKEDATQMVNSVAIYDQNGNFLRRMGDSEAQKLCGVMEQHVTQGNDGAARADASAKKILADGKLQKTVTVNVLGDMSLLTGETVVVREGKTGLTGIFWIDADVHTWKNKNYYTKLTLNCRNVMATADAGSEVK